jgi:hypothetical protein
VFDYFSQHSTVSELMAKSDYTPAGVTWSYATELGDVAGEPDTLATMTSYGHSVGKEMFWSLRMNDTHDTDNALLRPQWKSDHPDCMMSPTRQWFPYGAHRWTAANYEQSATRGLVYDILHDVASRYDVDGLELDFNRHPVYFKEEMNGGVATQDECNEITQLLRDVRTMTEEVGITRERPMLISVRVPDSVGFSKAIGLDLTQWLQEGLVDILEVGDNYHLEPWRNMVSFGHQYDVPVYACLSASRIGNDPLVWRGEAKNALEQGVDGIYAFNYVDDYSLLDQIGSLDTMEGLSSYYQWTPTNPDPRMSPLDYWLKTGADYVIPDLVAEPSTIVLVLVGMLAIGGWRWAKVVRGSSGQSVQRV